MINISYKSKLTNFKEFEEKNLAFDNLSDEDKRKEIAFDVINLILNEIIGGSYGDYWNYTMRSLVKDNQDVSLQKLFTNENLKNEENCEVCARGAVMLSTVRLNNKLNFQDRHVQSGNSFNVKGFNIDVMHIMEREYEASDYDHPYNNNTTEKLLNMFCNVLSNGNFNEFDQTNYLELWSI
jgi:hypothetical protein